MTSIVPSEAKVALKLFSAIKKTSICNTQNKILTLLETNQISTGDAKRKSPSYLACSIRTIEVIERASADEKIETLKK